MEGLWEKTGRQNLSEIVHEVHPSATPLSVLLNHLKGSAVWEPIVIYYYGIDRFKGG